MMVNLRKPSKTESFLSIVYLLTIYNTALHFIPQKRVNLYLQAHPY